MKDPHVSGIPEVLRILVRAAPASLPCLEKETLFLVMSPQPPFCSSGGSFYPYPSLFHFRRTRFCFKVPLLLPSVPSITRLSYSHSDLSELKKDLVLHHFAHFSSSYDLVCHGPFPFLFKRVELIPSFLLSLFSLHPIITLSSVAPLLGK